MNSTAKAARSAMPRPRRAGGSSRSASACCSGTMPLPSARSSPTPSSMPGQRSMQVRPDSVAFTHTVADRGQRLCLSVHQDRTAAEGATGHGHRACTQQYRQAAAIATQVYNHNFLNIDGAGTNAGLLLSTVFPLVAESVQDPQMASIAGNRVTYTGTMLPGQRVSTRLAGYGPTAPTTTSTSATWPAARDCASPATSRWIACCCGRSARSWRSSPSSG